MKILKQPKINTLFILFLLVLAGCTSANSSSAPQASPTATAIQVGVERPPTATPAPTAAPATPTRTTAEATPTVALSTEAQRHFDKGKTAYGQQDNEMTIAEMTTVIDLEPGYLYAYQYRMLAYYALEMYDETLLDLDKMIELQPESAALYHNRGQIYGFLENDEAGLADYNRVLSLDPAFTEAYFARGRLYQRMGQVENSIEDYRRFRELSDDSFLKDRYFAQEQIDQMTAAMSEAEIMAQYQRGQTALDSGDYEAAISALTYVVDYDPELTDAQFLRGKAKVRYTAETNLELDLTRLDLIRTIERDPTNAEAHYYLGLAHLQNETGSGSASDDALAEFEQALTLDPALGAVHLPQGLAYLYTQQHQAAIDSLSRAIDVEPNTPEIYFWRGWAYRETEALAEAAADFEQYLAAGNDPFWRTQAETQLALLSSAGQSLSPELNSRYHAAKREFLELLKYTDDEFDFMSEDFKNRYNALLDEFTAIAEAAPGQADPYLRRGLIYYVLKQYDEAEQDFTTAIQLAPTYALPAYYRGLAYAALEQPAQAPLADYEQAIALNPAFAQAYYARGLIYKKQSAPDKAIANFEDYLALATADNLAKQKILFHLTLIPLGDYVEKAQEHLQNLEDKAE